MTLQPPQTAIRRLRRPVPARVTWKIVVVAAIVPLCLLTVALQGAVPEKTYIDSEIPASSVQATVVYFQPIGDGRWSLIAGRIDTSSSFLSAENPFQAIILRLPSRYEPGRSWHVRWVSVTYTLTADSSLQYEMLLLSRNTVGGLTLDAQGPVLLSHQEAFTDIYRLDATSSGQEVTYDELTLVEPLVDDFSILIVKTNHEPGGFSFFKLDSIELMSSTVTVRYGPVASLEELTVMTIGAAVAVTVIPGILLLVLAFRLELPSSRSQRIFMRALLIYGIVVRLVLAPFTGHPYDMEVWTQSARLYYESGLTGLRFFPLPFAYYALLLAYSPYAGLRILGLQDPTFLGHISGMIESVFIKAPFMLSDILALYVMFEICRKLDVTGRVSSRWMAFGLMYFLNPLAIYLSSVWGMYDSIAVALFLGGIYLGLLGQRAILSGLSYAVSGLTKGFGFLGLIPLFVNQPRERRALEMLAVLGIATGVAGLLYLPLIAGSTVESIPEIVSQFFRGRAGLGSSSRYVAGASYLSYLQIVGVTIEPLYLTLILIVLLMAVSMLYVHQTRGSPAKAGMELVFRYFASVFLISYLVFFRVYEQYYLWAIPILILYSYVRRVSGAQFVASSLGIVLTPPLFGTLVAGTAYYYGLPVNPPVDMAILTVLASTLVVCGLVSIAHLKGRLAVFETDRGMAALAGPALWFAFTLACYGYYKTLFLGMAWYPISVSIGLGGAAFLYKKLKHS